MDGLMENPIKMDDLGVPLFSETSMWWFSQVLKCLICDFSFAQTCDLKRNGPSDCLFDVWELVHVIIAGFLM